MAKTHWEVGDPLPHDGWYNGNIELQILNGTYEYYRPKHMDRIEYKIPGWEDLKSDVEAADKQWAELSHEEKVRRYEAVVENTTPKVMKVHNPESGRMMEKMGATPSNNGAYSPIQRKNRKEKPAKDRARGAIPASGAPVKKVKELTPTA